MKTLRRSLINDAHWRQLKRLYYTDTKFWFVSNIILILPIVLVVFLFLFNTAGKGVAHSANDINWCEWAPDGYTVELHSVRAESGSNPTSFAKEMWEHYKLEEAISADFYADIFLRINPEIRDPYKDFHAGSLYTIPVYSPISWAEDES
ncbi:MAG TPA: hypothetical protein DCW90_02275 [Lachnospiraceae bacterium]|nr:hypothetical protein [Lachnospiraceae bacterium]